MNKKILALIIAVIFICVGLSGCDESDDDEDVIAPSIYTVIEAVAQVVNSVGEPITGVSVTFEFSCNDQTTKTVHLTTDSTGWTGFAVESVSIGDSKSAHCIVYLTNNTAIRELYNKYHSEIQHDDLTNDVYYWSISARLVQD